MIDAFVADVRACPELAHHIDLFLEALRAVREFEAHRPEFERVVADRDAEDEAATRENIHLRRLLRGKHRLPLRKANHGGNEGDLAGDGGEIRHQREHLADHALVGIGRLSDAAVALRDDADDMIRQANPLETEVFGKLHELDKRLEFRPEAGEPVKVGAKAHVGDHAVLPC